MPNSNKEIEIKRLFYQFESDKKMREIMDYLTENQANCPEYNGWVWLQGKLMHQPEILFIGYNPAQSKDPCNSLFFPFTGERPLTFFEDNNAYFNEERYKEERRDTHWFEFDEKESNTFTWQIIDILRNVVKGIHPEQTSYYKETKVPLWGAFPSIKDGGPGFGSKITFINLYPIATNDIGDFKAVAKYLENAGFFKKVPKQWACKYFFIEKVKKLAISMAPKLIVCIGAETYHDFTCDCTSTKKDINGIFYNKEYRNVIGFERPRKKEKGSSKNNSWPRKAIADKICELYCENNMI